MGCCLSSNTARQDVGSAGDPRNANNLPNLDGANGGSARSRPGQRPNQPIRPPSPLAKSPRNVNRFQPPWTRTQYETEINDYFDTRIGGENNVWDAVRAACDCVRRGNLAEAQGILDAADINCPTGRVCKNRSATVRDAAGNRVRGGLYDAAGHLYEVPNWVISVPLDLIEDTAVEKDVNAGASDTESEEPSSQPASKGKERAPDADLSTLVKVRYSAGTHDEVFTMRNNQPISVLRRLIADKRGTTNFTLVFLGKLLEESKTLEDYGYTSGQIVSAYIAEGDEGPNESSPRQGTALGSMSIK